MKKDQENQLAKHSNRIDEQGNSLVKGSMLWVLNELSDNLDKVNDLIGPKHDRVSKRDLKIVLRDIYDQVKELRRRID